jgi:hypothetical protein
MPAIEAGTCDKDLTLRGRESTNKERPDCSGSLARTVIARQSLGKLRNNCSKFIEYLVPALYFAAILCALHRVISN